MAGFGIVPQVECARKPRVRGHTCRIGCALLLLVTHAGSAWCQIRSQLRREPVVTSSPATVVLVARLESLSVVASEVGAAQEVPGGLMAFPVAVRTSWAVPANFTTFRLVGYLGPTSGIQSAVGQNRRHAISVQGSRVSGAPSQELILDSGETNKARTRIDELEADADASALSEQRVDDPPGLLDILVQAF